ncbi:hypothetical protein LINPERHAP1_LOCUS31921 [Linum perenne]
MMLILVIFCDMIVWAFPNQGRF